MYNPLLIALFEPRISGKKTNDFILKSGFDRSHRIETVAFRGGIWLFERKGFNMHIVINHKRLVYLHISNAYGFVSSLSVVYNSLIPLLRNLF